jgi:Sulfotransferase domain
MSTGRPGFLIVGAAKCGTSSLAAALNTHRDIYLPDREIHYFSKYRDKGDAWYLDHFNETTEIQGEKSPTYLYYRNCHRDIYRLLPGAKLVILLRNPVDRAFSNWHMRYNDKRLITQGMHFNRTRSRNRWINGLDFPVVVDYYLSHRESDDLFQKPLDIIHRGLYYEQIENLLRFFQRENMLILVTECMEGNEEEYYDRVCDFLDLPAYPWSKEALQKRLVGQYSKTMAPEVREKLHHFYRPYNEKLFQLLGDEIQEWED